MNPVSHVVPAVKHVTFVVVGVVVGGFSAVSVTGFGRAASVWLFAGARKKVVDRACVKDRGRVGEVGLSRALSSISLGVSGRLLNCWTELPTRSSTSQQALAPLDDTPYTIAVVGLFAAET